MILDIQFKLRSNPRYIQYLHENSEWYKILNRNPMMFKVFEEKVKEDYKLRTSDKITKALSTIEMFQNIFSSLK
jgi:hypothetical protein